MTPRRWLAAVATVAGVALIVLPACSGNTTPAEPASTGGTPPPSGTPAIDRAYYPDFVAGNAPLIIIAPHGGLLAPEAIPDRTCAACTTVNDANTQDLARQLADSFAARTGRRPWLVVNLLHRRKFDGNREVVEATGGFAPLQPVWEALHAAVDSARRSIERSSGRGIVVDLHGHAHTIQRLELGYLIGDATLRLSDSALVTQGALARSSIARISAERAGVIGPVTLLRGSLSLGALMVAAGYPSVPSPNDPAPAAGEPYFEGGYNTDRHGSVRGAATDAIQIECYFAGVRDTESNRGRFAAALAAALDRMLRDEYGWRP